MTDVTTATAGQGAGPVYSQRLGPIHPQQFQAALDRFGLGEFLGAAPVTRGLFGQNVFVSSSKGEFALRGCPHYDWQFPKERLGAALLAQHTRAPVAHPYLLDEATDIFGWSYLWMPRLLGVAADDPSLSEADRFGVAEALGHNLAEMHTLTRPCAGGYALAVQDIQPFTPSFADWIIADMRDWLARSRANSDATTPTDVTWVEQIIAIAEPALRVPFQACFVMNDYNPGNTLVQKMDGRWRVSGVFDLMEYYFGDGEADLMRLMSIYKDRNDTALATRFARTYLERRPARPGFVDRFAFYMLRDRLIIWQFGTRTDQGWFPAGLTLRQYAEPYIGLLGELGL